MPGHCSQCGAKVGPNGLTGGLCPQCLLKIGLGGPSATTETAAGSPEVAPTGILRTGMLVGHYRVAARLGVGGMGEVYRAHDTRLGRDVALKALPGAMADHPGVLARFRREAQLLAALNHPNIGAIYGVEEADETSVLVLELVEGESLADRLTRGPLGVEEALGIARQVAEALEASHERGIVHRDLKPSNVMIGPKGTVKVLDFGIATGPSSREHGSEPTRLTQAGALIGTAGYMSPEQARGEPVDPRADIWAFGCILYETITGHPAFLRPSLAETLSAILEREPPLDRLAASVPPAIVDLLSRCLQKDRERRLSSIGDAARAIRDAQSDQESLRTTGRRTLPGWRRHVATAFAISGPLLILLALSAPALRGGKVGGLSGATGLPAFLSDGGPVALVTVLVIGLALSVSGVLRRAWHAAMRGPLGRFTVPRFVPMSTLLSLLAFLLGAPYTGALFLGIGLLAVVPPYRPRPERHRWWVLGMALLALGTASYSLESWDAKRTAVARNDAVDVCLVLPFQRLNDENDEQLLHVTEHYRSVLEAVFADLDSVRILPDALHLADFSTLPPQCSFGRVERWVHDRRLAPDMILCSTVDVFHDVPEHSGLVLVSTLSRPRGRHLEPMSGWIRDAGAYDDIEWLALRASAKVIQAIASDPGLRLSTSDDTTVRRRILERYAMFLSFRNAPAPAAAARTRSAPSATPPNDDELETILASYSSPVDIEAYASRQENNRKALSRRVIGD